MLVLLLFLAITTVIDCRTIRLSDTKETLRHLAKLGFLTQYVENVTLQERSMAKLVVIPERSGRPEKNLIFPRSLIRDELNSGRTVLNYLDEFGYLGAYTSLKGSDDTLLSTNDLLGSLTLFQHMNSLAPTGSVDYEVLARMKIPRCGVPDLDPNDPNFLNNIDLQTVESIVNTFSGYDFYQPQRNNDMIAWNKRFELADERWDKNRLTFYIENYSDTLGKHSYTEIVRAFEVWTDKVELFLYEVKHREIADIRIKFISKEHGDKYPFDGAMGVLAHAFYPTSGEVHFDNDEEFTRFTRRGVNLRYTASHEFGHTLGLKHSLKEGSLMTPYHPGYTEEITLQQDDLNGISRLFRLGRGQVYSYDTAEAMEYERFLLRKLAKSQDSKPKAENSPCIEKIDAAMQHPHTKTMFFFTKDVYYKVERGELGEIGVVAGYPKYISEGWDGLEGNLDAAYVNVSLSAAFFFKGNKYWKYDFNNKRMYPGFPATTLPKVPRDLTATIMSAKTSYFFSDSQILQHDGKTNTIKNIPHKQAPNVEAAFPLFVNGYFATTHGSTYSIFKVKTFTEVRVYHGRPLSWDYGLPMCVDDLIAPTNLNPKMKPFCDAYALLAHNDANLVIPRECYSILRPFPVVSLNDISDNEDL